MKSSRRFRSTVRRLVTEHLEARLTMTAGALDVTFGGNGIATLDLQPVFDLSSRDNQAVASVTLADGKSLVATVYTDSQGSQINRFSRLSRLTPDGLIDTAWSGIQSSKILSGVVQDLAIDSEGRIVIASNVGDGLSQQTRIVRLLANGEDDGTFGANVVIPNFQNQNGVFARLVARSIAIDSSDSRGRILAKHLCS